MKPISHDINKIIYKVYKVKHPILGEIIFNWQKIVGIKYSNNTLPIKINSTRENNKKINILFIEVDKSSISVEIAFQQDIIIERIAIYMGYKAINKIRTLVRG